MYIRVLVSASLDEQFEPRIVPRAEPRIVPRAEPRGTYSHKTLGTASLDEQCMSGAEVPFYILFFNSSILQFFSSSILPFHSTFFISNILHFHRIHRAHHNRRSSLSRKRSIADHCIVFDGSDVFGEIE